MKKISLFGLLATSLVLVACGTTETPTTQDDFALADCNKYFEVLQCVLDNQTGVSPEELADTQAAVVQQKEAWKALPEGELTEICTSSMDDIRANADIYASFGCSVE
ncbi:MAG: hypothetical protein LBD11_03390 [Candidatus Peribacteria bacterium]|jgi:hypothetical protein|nr:hypothetical protein [Candidatus Peribacteria bacterium]